MTRAFASALLPALCLLLAACGRQPVNPPTDPAQPIQEPADDSGKRPSGGYLPGRGPATFVGRWAGKAAWCLDPAGARRPIEISTTRFEGYENSCAISDIAQDGDGYDVALSCAAEGMVTRERIRLAVAGDDMRLTWLTRGGLEVAFKRCPSPDVKTEPETLKP
jgi:hypothetical protein